MDALLRSAKRGAYAGLAQLVSARALQAWGYGFESLTPHHVAVVQLVEYQIVALVVVDSSSTGHPRLLVFVIFLKKANQSKGWLAFFFCHTAGHVYVYRVPN